MAWLDGVMLVKRSDIVNNAGSLCIIFTNNRIRDHSGLMGSYGLSKSAESWCQPLEPNEYADISFSCQNFSYFSKIFNLFCNFGVFCSLLLLASSNMQLFIFTSRHYILSKKIFCAHTANTAHTAHTVKGWRSKWAYDCIFSFFRSIPTSFTE